MSSDSPTPPQGELDWENIYGDFEYMDSQDFITHMKQIITAQVQAAEARGREAAFNKIFEMAPKQNFEHWGKRDIADWFIALGELERSLAALGDSHE